MYLKHLKDTSINSLKPRWRRWKIVQNARVLRVHSAFSRISALPSHLDRIYRGVLKLILIAASLGLLPAAVMAMTGDREQPIHIEADSVDIDDKKGISVYRGNVRMTQGSIVLTADTVTTYASFVTETKPGAEGKKKERQLDKIIAEGKLANYRQLLDSKDAVTGKNEELRARAERIDYFASEERVVLQRSAYLWKEGSEFSGNVIEYSGREETVKASKAQTGQERVQAVIQPRRKEKTP